MKKLNSDNIIDELRELGLQYFFVVVKRGEDVFYDVYVFPEVEGGIQITLKLVDERKKFCSFGRIESGPYEVLDELMYEAIFSQHGEQERICDIHSFLDSRVEE